MSSPTWAQAHQHEELTDSIADAVEHRIVMLELALVDRRVRRQLRREIRKGQRDFAWAGSDPVARRMEATFNAWLSRPRP